MQTLDDVLSSKIYVKNGSIDFKSPKEYLMPFIDLTEKITDNYKVRVSGTVENAEEASGELNTSYGRVLIEAHLPDKYGTEETGGIIGLVYGLDIQKPVMKVYTGQNIFACTNLCVFGAQHVFSSELLTTGSARAYQEVSKYVEEKERELENYIRVSTKLKEMQLDKESLDELIGKLVRESLKSRSIGITPITTAAKDLYDPKSKYAVKDGQTNGWNVYNAITEYITHKTDILDMAHKTVLLQDMFLN